MKIHNGFYRTSIKALVLDKKKRFLLCKEDNGQWDLPGGAMNFGETYEETLKREIREEMGLEVIKIGKYPMYFMVSLTLKKLLKTNIVFEIKLKNLKFTPSGECMEIKFFDNKTVLKENISSGVRKFAKIYDPKRH
jgi:8-oxo-dGTP pyrophosphatase MutT (NUDIX family)